MGVIIYSFDWTLHLKCHMVCLSVILLLLLCYRIACLWFWDKRFCNKTGVLFVPDPAFVMYLCTYVYEWEMAGCLRLPPVCYEWPNKRSALHSRVSTAHFKFRENTYWITTPFLLTVIINAVLSSHCFQTPEQNMLSLPQQIWGLRHSMFLTETLNSKLIKLQLIKPLML